MALSLAVSAVSCGNDTKDPLRSGDLTTESGIRNTSWKKNPSGYDTITVFYDETKVCDEDLTGAYPVAVSEDKIYYVSYGYNEEDKWNGYIADLSGGAIQADEHDDIAAAAMIYRDDKRIVYCGMDDDDDGSIVSLDLSNGNTVYAETGYVRYAVSDPSGNIYVINELFKLKYFDSSLNLVKEYDLSEQMKNDFSERFMYDMCVSDDGKVYFVISEKYVCHNIYTVTEEGKLIDITGEITDLDGCVNRLFTNSDGNLVLATGYGTVLTDVIDPETGNVLYMYENYGADELIGTSEKYDLIYTMADGIYGYNYKEDSEELIVSEDVIPHVSSSYASSFMQGDMLYMSLAEPVPPSLYVVDRKTGETSKSEFPGCDCACVGPDGKLYYISSEFQLKSSDDGYTYETVLCSVYRHDDDGNDTLLFNLPELEFESQTADLVINSEGDLIVLYDDEDGNRYLMIYDNSGNLKSTVYPEDFTEYDISLFLNEDKNVYLAIADVIENKTHIYSLDSQNNELKEAGSLDVSSTQRIQNGNCGYDLYYTDLAGIIGWKAESGTTEEVIQLADIDGSLYNRNIVYSQPLIMNTSELACANGIKLVKADEERLAELNSREVLTLAVSGTEPINRYVSRFNRESDSCHILLKDYRRNGNPFDYSDGKAEMDDLAKDIIDNNIPDIIMLDYMDLSSYITKDFFADLKEIADNDPEFDLSDIYQNVQDAFTFNNCLYTIPGCISQSTLTAAEKIQSMDYRTLADSMDFC